jgi:hypothetical protein
LDWTVGYALLAELFTLHLATERHCMCSSND